ncbi:uncharacterized protein [Panulirus ornatus]|uniref:uncharacterized protein n=1 Tax=Panulirus ornatus TaxID=150431 RepID=UPI003A88AE92
MQAYPDFAVAAETSKKIKGKFARILKQAILNGEIEGEERYVIAISRAGHHQNHQNEMAEEKLLPVHPDIVQYITKLVTDDNITSPKMIKALVSQFSREHFSLDEMSSGDRCFYPIVKDIRTILRRILCNMQTSKFCQATLEEDVKVLTEEHELDQKIIVSSETLGIMDNMADNQDVEKHIFNMSEGYLTLILLQEPPDDGIVATHIVSAQDAKCELEKVTEIQTVSNISEDIDTVSSVRFRLLAALEQAVQQVTEVTSPQALKEALRYVEKASFVLESSLNK